MDGNLPVYLLPRRVWRWSRSRADARSPPPCAAALRPPRRTGCAWRRCCCCCLTQAAAGSPRARSRADARSPPPCAAAPRPPRCRRCCRLNLAYVLAQSRARIEVPPRFDSVRARVPPHGAAAVAIYGASLGVSPFARASARTSVRRAPLTALTRALPAASLHSCTAGGGIWFSSCGRLRRSLTGVAVLAAPLVVYVLSSSPLAPPPPLLPSALLLSRLRRARRRCRRPATAVAARCCRRCCLVGTLPTSGCGCGAHLAPLSHHAAPLASERAATVSECPVCLRVLGGYVYWSPDSRPVLVFRGI